MTTKTTQKITGDVTFSQWTVFKIGFFFGCGMSVSIGFIYQTGRLLNFLFKFLE